MKSIKKSILVIIPLLFVFLFSITLVSGQEGQDNTDVCPNIAGVQAEIPDGKRKDASGDCVSYCDTTYTENQLICQNDTEYEWRCVKVDVCLNIEGYQKEAPKGYISDGDRNCSPIEDVCPNLSGTQTTVPSGYIKNSSGNCVLPTSTDVCPNIDGVQTTVPPYYFKNGSECTPYGQIEVQSIDTSGWNESCTVKISCSYDSPINPHKAYLVKIDSGTEININECKGKAVAAVNRGDTCGAPVSYVNWYDNSSLPKSWWFH